MAHIRSFATFLFGIWAVVTISFACLYLLPGDPARIILGPQASAASIAQFRSERGIDRPVPVQYGQYIARLARLDLGYSFTQRQPVRALLWERGRISMALAATAFLIALFLGIALPLALGAFGADRSSQAFSAVLQLLAFVPAYLLALAALAVAAGWLGIAPVRFDSGRAVSWILAAVVLSMYPAALLFRIFLQSLQRELGMAYALRAAAAGFPRSTIVLREAFPNALPAPLASAANAVAFFFTSAFFIETVIGIAGLGRLAQDAVRQKDLATLSGVCLAYCVVVVSTSALLNALAALSRRGRTR